MRREEKIEYERENEKRGKDREKCEKNERTRREEKIERVKEKRENEKRGKDRESERQTRN